MTAREMIYSLNNRLKKDAGKDIDIIYHFQISGDGGGDFTVRVMNGECSVTEGLEGEAKCIISADAKDYTDAELGLINVQMAVMFGKIKVSNIGSMMKFVEMFEKVDLPK